ncbi:MAG: efflux RND transporter periplasmic adaptor subunit [Gemmataceae bacterium]|nr:efflux RND transporter periplasmic adaptor subunit [Gemmataceae bacterium]
MSTDSRPGPFARAIGIVKTVLTAGLALAALGLFLAWMGGAFHEKVPPGVAPVERPKVGTRTLVAAERTVGTESITAVGSVQPRRKTEIASQLLATIRELKPRSGDRVKAKDILVVLDDRELNAQQREATASLAAAEADLVTRRSNYERIKALKGAVSAEEFNNVEGAFRVAETQVRRAKETIGRIEVQITYARIAATSDGIVADRFAEPGDLASPGKPLLTLYDPNDLELHVNVPESLASGLGIGKPLGIRIDANNWATTATVREIVPLAQQASRSVLVKLGLSVPSSVSVLPGMFGRAVIPVGEVERVWLPQAAVQRLGQLDLVDIAGTDGFLTRRFVRLGKTFDGKVEILSGLSGGERVALPSR